MGKIVIDRPHQIIAVGDSLTAGSQPGITDYAPYTGPNTRDLLPTSYPYVLSDLLSVSMGPRLIRNLGRGAALPVTGCPGPHGREQMCPVSPSTGGPWMRYLLHGRTSECAF